MIGLRREKSLFAFSKGGNPGEEFKRSKQTSSRGLFQRALDERQAALGLLAEQLFAIAAVFLRAVQLVGNRQRRKYGNFLCVDGRGGRRNCVHFFVYTRCQLVDVRFVQFAANRVHLPEYLDFYGTAHVSGL